MKSGTIISTAAMLAVFAAIAAPSKKGEKASPAKNRDADRSAEFRNGTITKTTAATFKPERTTPVQTGEFQVDLVVITFPDCIQPQSVEAVRSALNSLDGSATIAPSARLLLPLECVWEPDRIQRRRRRTRPQAS